ncbi:hypothetical protein HOE22_05025 [Candidatus Woesearchaeota archaeon]|nr:hypothetical protein [Candidatus Woesearchaeota archaeon]MBT4732557.1 hypothetical protein [Candidatus Woesearchaeota archaeon]MBT7556407.1 hypothetical protein [Candidatus Woesearchaeota archaeon]
MKNKLSLRLKLTDFINTEIELKIMEKINSIHKDLHIAVMLHLWFDEGEVTNKDLKEFLIRWEDKLSFKTVVKQGSHIKPNEFIWFDINPKGLPYSSRKRFEFGYINKEHILHGLQDFYNVAKFTTSEKSFKKQKRNDYED